MKTTTKTLIAASSAALFLLGCATTQKWQYRTLTSKEHIGAVRLDQYGKSGWELVQFERIPIVHEAA